jgi:hypothetical protein
MNVKFLRRPWPAIALSVLAIVQSAQAQSGAALSGTVTSVSGAAVPGARVTAKNLNTGQSTDLQADTAGHFDFAAPAPAEFEITVTAEGFDSKTVKVNFIPGAAEAVSVTLTAIPGWTPPPQTNLPNAPSSSQTGPSLSDLGFPAEQTRGDTKQQVLLDKRTRMLKIHQKLGLITTAPLLATLIASPGAGGKSTSARTARCIWYSVRSRLIFISRARTSLSAHPGYPERRPAVRSVFIRHLPGYTVRE